MHPIPEQQLCQSSIIILNNRLQIPCKGADNQMVMTKKKPDVKKPDPKKAGTKMDGPKEAAANKEAGKPVNTPKR